MKRAYLDNAATTPVRSEVIKVMGNTLRYSFGNPSSTQHSYGREARSIIEESRIRIAKNIKAYPSEIIFTSCGTEANNIILRSAVIDLKVQCILTSPLEHYSVLQTVSDLSYRYKVLVEFIKIEDKGIIDLNHLEMVLKKNFTKRRILVSLMYANNEIGNLLEIDKVGILCKKYNTYFHSDTIQIIGNYPINMKKSPLDFATASAHKFYGPKGIGFVFIREKFVKKIKPLITGGNQEYGIRSGTENVYGIVGLSKALHLACCNLTNHMEKILNLKLYCISELKKTIPNIVFNGLSDTPDKSVPTILNIFYPKKDHLLYFHLDLMGVSISNGSSCNSIGFKNISHVIKSIDNKNLLKDMTPIRISFGFFNNKKDVDLLIKAFNKIKN
ncbi:MAG: cysteine desulfurase [Flavobacteriales bacterium]|jgi:cysteine desulfurase|uniref:cysteine desulfurase family protein n=1 Tax=Blattabacterium sp. (Mastotermes darwiniensis) TaxID=39768 RepID=UPI000231DEBD|nr:cysteine desulfurase family protein [Blattabacterium sp. (Mastotermes darwiniensis)]AER40753.1 cysteine desulfurase [Blattabacterium sp. (Mastotermes darwiniensis) str. MADAR]MDR1805136.1 cysteine desulfurase [Flavobacteriales bacterium]